MRQKVANYPGVTVERKEGVWPLSSDGTHARLVDLPGLYSLDAASIDERIARDVVTGRVAEVPRPDVVVAVVDATNLERNLYLTTQLLEMGRPVVVALTMVDLAERARVEIDAAKLSAALGVPVVPVVATRGRGLDELAAAVIAAAEKEAGTGAGWRLSPRAEAELSALINASGGNGAAVTPGSTAPTASSPAPTPSASTVPPSSTRPRGDERHEALLTLYGEELPTDEELRARVEAARARLATANPRWWQEPVVARYEWIADAARGAVRIRDKGRGVRSRSATERIDRFVTHKFSARPSCSA